jgi:mono/diheme cytochrome c family protein
MNRNLQVRSGLCGLAAITALVQLSTALAADAEWAPLPMQLLTQPIADATPNTTQLRRGQSLVIEGDCLSCHLRDGGEPFAGGLGLKTPFGLIYTPNITSDKDTGIGAWTADQFFRAMHDGIGVHGENLYPAFPYPWFRRVSRTDDDAMLAFLKTTPAVRYTPPANKLTFPLNVRMVVKGWNLLYLDSHEYRPDPTQSAEWNRGAYLVTGLGHCSGCHTPKNAFGADKSSQAFAGGEVDNWIAPDLTSNDRTGLGGWSIDEVAAYLRDGRNVHAGAGGPMAEAVTLSTSLMSNEDRHAIAVYLKRQPASPTPALRQIDAGAMQRGAAIYSDACASCHLENGVGQPEIFPPLGHNAMLQQSNAAGLEHLVLAGGRIGVSASRPSPLSMPSFAWKLSDSEIADVATFLRNSWGNKAAPISALEVHAARQRLGLETGRLTANSGDQN